jgi:hypothetical protein
MGDVVRTSKGGASPLADDDVDEESVEERPPSSKCDSISR